jgi:ammonium transporter, Amt family
MGVDLVHPGLVDDARIGLLRRSARSHVTSTSHQLCLAGLLKSVNTVPLVTQIIGGASILSVMWHLIGYTLVFGPTWGGVIGKFDNILMFGVPYDDCSHHAPTIPAALFGFFEMMFAAISPLLITGAFAERLKYKSFVVFIIGWELFIYYPVAHWIWGDGWLNDKFEVQVNPLSRLNRTH